MADEKCVEHGAKVDALMDQIESMHGAVRDIAQYVPKIEVALERLANVQDVLKSYADVNKEQFQILRSQSEEIHLLQMKVTANEGRLIVLEQSRNGIMGVANNVLTWGVVAALAGVAVLMATHGVGLGK